MRLKRLRQAISETGAEAILVSDPENILYLSGFSGGDDGQLFITESDQYIITDGRYETQAAEECPDFKLMLRSSVCSGLEILKNLVIRHNVRLLAFEGGRISADYWLVFDEALPCSLVSMSGKLALFRSEKSEEEIVILRQAAMIANESFAAIKPLIRPGVTEIFLAAVLEYEFKKRGAEGTSFATIVASGDRGAFPHHRPGDREIKSGELVTFDFGCRYQGYCSDETSTVALGCPPDKLIDAYFAVREAQRQAISEARCGLTGAAIDALAYNHIMGRGYGDFIKHGLGHGVGLAIHELPFMGPGCNTPVTENMVVTIEPGIYIPGLGGVRLENMCVMTKTGLTPIIDYGSRKLEILQRKKS